jgi:hypothetical protein
MLNICLLGLIGGESELVSVHPVGVFDVIANQKIWFLFSKNISAGPGKWFRTMLKLPLLTQNKPADHQRRKSQVQSYSSSNHAAIG